MVYIKINYSVTDVYISGNGDAPVYIKVGSSDGGGSGTVTSVDMTVPTGLTVSGNPITSSGTLAVSYASGYSIPTTAKQGEWDQAYNDKINSAAVTGTTTKTLTLNQQDGGTITASWSDLNTDAVTSVFGRTGAVTASEGDYTLTQLGDVTISSPTNGQVLKYNGTTWVNNTDTDTGLTSVGLTMPSAFTVSNSPLTSNGTIAVTGAGTASQYVRGDGQLGDFPQGGGGGGASVSYYLNGSVNQGTFGGNTYYEMNKNAIIGTGSDFSIGSNGYIAQFITDANDPNLLIIPAGNWNLEFYFSASSGGGNPNFYAELYKYDGTNFTLIASGSTSPELIAFGTTINPYFTALAVPETVLTATDRLAIRIYVNTSGRTITLHTENSHLCQIITTFTTGLTALNGLTKQVQFFATGSSGTDFNISSVTDTHTFNLPTASATNRGALSSTDWTTFNNKQNALTNPITGSAASGQVAYFTGATTQAGSANFTFDGSRVGIARTPSARRLEIQQATGSTAASIGLYVGGGSLASIIGIESASTNDFQIASTAGIRFYTGSTIGNIVTDPTNERMRLFSSTGNLLLQNGGTFTDGGQRLQVIGSARIGSTAASAMYWDDTNSRLGVGVASPSVTFDLSANVQEATPLIKLTNTRTYTSSYSKGIDLLSPNIGAGTAIFAALYTGKSASNNNGFGINYYHVADGSTSNYGDISFYGADNILVWNAAKDIAINTTTFATSTKLTIAGSKTASSAIARATLINTTLTAAANNDVLVGLDVNPTFTNGAFTGVTNTGIRINSNVSSPALVVKQITATTPAWLSVRNNDNINLASSISADIGISGGTNQFFNGTAQGDVVFKAFSTGNTSKFFIGATNSTTPHIVLFPSTNNMSINSTTDAGFRLDVNGTARVQGGTQITGTATTDALRISTNVSASSGFGYLGNFIGTLTATANNDDLTAININPTWSVGAFTGTLQNAIKAAGTIRISSASSVNWRYIIGHATTAFLTSTYEGGLYGTTDAAGAYPYNGNGHVVLQGRSTADRDILIVNGATPTTQMVFFGSSKNVAIGTTTDVASAVLNVASTTKGFLPPRMTGAQAEAIATPADGLMVYINNGNGTTITSTGFWGRDAGAWVKLN